MTSDYAKGRADAFKEAISTIKSINYSHFYVRCGLDIAREAVEALAQQPQPKRECGTCRFKFGDGKCHDCIRERIFERLEYINWQPKESV